MNFAQMLSSGPMLIKGERSRTGYEKNSEAIRNHSISKYREASENGIVHSKMIAKKFGIGVKSAGKQLLKYHREGLLDIIGKLDIDVTNKPIIYKWR